MTIKKVTAFSVHQTGVGQQVAFTYSIVDENGAVVAQNKRAEVVLINQEQIDAAASLYSFLETKIPE